MNQTGQFSDIDLLDKLDRLLESAETELQRTATMLQLDINTEQAFEGTLSKMKEVESVALDLKNEDARIIASEKILLFSRRFNEVVEQVKN
ncbi:hypothetical protein MOE90_21065 [Bacillus spizizenii]|nr:hypothetical protein [Bacillus spizizenii]MCY9124997.1 hypothetical protein [Bacillus spizizenii]